MSDATEKEQSAALEPHNTEQAQMYALAELLGRLALRIAAATLITAFVFAMSIFAVVMTTLYPSYYQGIHRYVAMAVPFTATLALNFVLGQMVAQYITTKARLQIMLYTISKPE